MTNNATWKDDGPFITKNGWKIEFSDDHPEYVARVVKGCIVWGYYTQDEVKMNAHIRAQNAAAKETVEFFAKLNT
jgi:hypothetical protein